jgi:hypothetical protein
VKLTTHLGSLLGDLHGIALLSYQHADPCGPPISPSAVEVQPVLASHAAKFNPMLSDVWTASLYLKDQYQML